jgi:RimJ/RimL family protein N-acetyltransferase
VDAAFLAGLSGHDDVEPFLGRATETDEASIREEIERSLAEPEALGRFVIEVEGERAGMMGFTRLNERNRIARLGGLAIHPDFRGGRLADEAARLLQRHLLGELGFHRLELEIYAFNERAVAHAERAGFVREGLRRKAYLRHGTWNDAVLFSLLAEDLER